MVRYRDQNFRFFFTRENKILDYIDPKSNIKKIDIVEVKGYKVGVCSVSEWSKKIPIIWFNDRWKIVLPGSLDSVIALRKEDLFANIELKNIENF